MAYREKHSAGLPWYLWCILLAATLSLGACKLELVSGGDVPITMSLNATAITPGEIELSWSAHTDNVTGYDIERNGEPLTAYHLSATGYTDRGLNAATTYCYVIYVVIDPFGREGRSDSVCVTTPPAAGWPVQSVDNGERVTMALDGNNRPHLIYRRDDGVAHGQFDGVRWSLSLIDATAGAFGDTSLALSPLGNVEASYYDDTDNSLRHASNTGGTWSSDRVASAGGNTNDIALDSAGNAHIAYSTTVDTTHALFHAGNSGGPWQSEFIAGFANNIADTDIVVDPLGVVHIAYATGDGVCAIRYAQNSAGSWNDNLIDSASRCGVSLAIDQSGTVHIVYPREFYLIHASNAGGTWQSEIVDSFSWIGGERVSVAIDAAEQLHIAYQDSNADLRYATNPGGVWQHHFIDVNGTVGAHPSIAIGSDGRVSIAYDDESLGTVKLATSPP